jgi:lambda family phage minor tail protein L
MRTLSTAALIEINKLATDSASIVLLEIGLTPIIRLAGNNEDITWNSQTWQAFPFELDTVGETGKGEIPAVVVRVSNVTGEIQRLLESVNGASGTAVTLRVINTAASTSTGCELELSFVVESSTYDEQWLTFRLSGGNCLTRRVPRRRYLRNFCPFTYGGVECGVSSGTVSTYPTCNKTFANCVTRSNSSRFGGYPWLPEL